MMCHAALNHYLQIRSTRLDATNGKLMRYSLHDPTTASCLQLQVRSEELDLGNIDGLLLLPITIEHTIDERSPLCGLTHASLQVR